MCGIIPVSFYKGCEKNSVFVRLYRGGQSSLRKMKNQIHRFQKFILDMQKKKNSVVFFSPTSVIYIRLPTNLHLR